MPKAVYRRKVGLRTLPRKANAKEKLRNASVNRPAAKETETSLNTTKRPSSVAKPCQDSTHCEPKVVWSNDRVRRQSKQPGNSASSELPHPFAAFDAEEVDLSIPSFQIQSVSPKQSTLTTDDQEPAVTLVDAVAAPEVTAKEPPVGTPTSRAIPKEASAEDREAGDTRSLKPTEKKGGEDGAKIAESWTEKAEKILSAYAEKETSVVSPLSSWYFLGGAPDFRPAASRRRKRKRTVQLFHDVEDDKIEVKRVKGENEQMLAKIQEKLAEVRSEDQKFTRTLLEDLGKEHADSPS